MSGFSWGLFQLNNFVSVNGPYFPVYFYICDFFVVESAHLNIIMWLLWKLDFLIPSGFAWGRIVLFVLFLIVKGCGSSFV